jgi:MFS family permease
LSGFADLLRGNRNYRYTWSGQVVSEVGDHYNNVAVFALALANTGSGLVVAGILISRAICAVLAGPIAGVLLDRMDRKRIMIISDLVRAGIAILFILGVPKGRTWLLYILSGALMFASPFFSSGRASILPTIATKDELHSANSLTQLTQWTTLTLGSFLGGTSVTQFGYQWAFFFNALSFLFSAWCIAHLHVEKGFRASRSDMVVLRPWHEYTEGLRYMKSSPLILGIGLVAVGWATGGGAAQILFSVFGEVVFHRGPSGIGVIWGYAGIGLIIGALQTHDFDLLRDSRRILRAVQPGADVRMGIVFHWLIARGRGYQQRAEHYATAPARFGRISRTGVRHHRKLELDDDDALDGGCGVGVVARKSARDWGLGRCFQFEYGCFLGLGELDGEAAGACAFRG